MAKVWNDSNYVWKEKFKGDEITIKPRDFVEMEYYDAYAFIGQFPGILRDANDQQLPENKKMLRVEGEPIVGEKPDISCQMCKEKFLSFKTLNEHVMHSHADALVVDEDAEAEIAKKHGRQRQFKGMTDKTDAT